MLAATQVAGLSCLRLMNDNTATALAYGIYKTDLPETDPVTVVFVDIGHTALQAALPPSPPSLPAGYWGPTTFTLVYCLLLPCEIDSTPSSLYLSIRYSHFAAIFKLEAFTSPASSDAPVCCECTPCLLHNGYTRCACSQISVVSFKKGQLQVLSHGWDRDLGGRDFDEALFDYWCKEFDTKFKLDVRSSPRASFRLRLACEKVCPRSM